ncbi:S8 family serine peptidase [Litorilinea aerophila]|nr:S8 family serine peptidase [Litorilinea aerophila]MCC9078937.1 S8 family serine peptidase [Litorilinea aerophila]
MSKFLMTFVVVTLVVGDLLALRPLDGALPRAMAATLAEQESPTIFIVQLQEPPLPLYLGQFPGLAATANEVTGRRRLNLESATSQAYLNYLTLSQEAALSTMETRLQRTLKPIFQYRLAVNGFALQLTPAEAALIQTLPGIARVQPEGVSESLTDFGPNQMGAPALWDGSAVAGVGTLGEGVIIGIIDSGINYRHPSFADVGADGYNHTNPRGRFYGVCHPVTGAPYCNDKVIGIYDFTGTTGGLDDDGHGSHIAATAAGNFVDIHYPAPNGPLRRLSGVAPHANLMIYKTSVNNRSSDSAILAAYEQAIADGVDVLNYSISGQGITFWRHAVAQAQLSAHAAGIVVAAAAGNAGPFSSAHMNAMPWVMAVGATTHHRAMPNQLTGLTGGNTAPPSSLWGTGQGPAYGPAPIVHARTAGDPYCAQPFPANTWTQGEIVVCDRGMVALEVKAANLKAGGASYFVLANTPEWGEATLHYQPGFALPVVHLGYHNSQTLRDWLAAGSNHRGSISAPTEILDPAFADRVTWFSSRGPNPVVADILKPDLAAPGAYILAADLATAQEAETYAIKSGTSMATPHAAGAAALLIALHPNWSPAAIQSVLMSTARHGLLLEDGSTASTPFDEGGGRINLPAAAQAGLYLDETAARFQAADPDFGGTPRTLNLASLTNGQCSPRCRWTRTVTSAAAISVTWQISTTAMPEVQVTTVPTSFVLSPGASQVITVDAVVSAGPGSQWYFGAITLTPAIPALAPAHLPLAIRQLHAVYLPAVTAATEGGWVTILREDFEGDFPGSSWKVADPGWARRNCLPYHGSFSGWAVGQEGSSSLPCHAAYPNNAFSEVVYGPFSLTDAADAKVELAYWTNTEGANDVLFWGASVDQVNFYGRRNWGTTNGWQTATFDLTDVFTLGDLRGQPRVWFALQFWSDGAGNLPAGAYVDDVVIRKYITPASAADTRRPGDGAGNGAGNCPVPANGSASCGRGMSIP